MSRHERQKKTLEARHLELRAEWHQKRIRLRSERFVPTADDWAPPYFLDDNGKQVEGNRESLEGAMVLGTVMLHPPPPRSKPLGRQLQIHETHWFVRICFWGNDDSGIEKDFYFPDHESAIEQYHRLVGYLGRIAIVSRRQLLNFAGFWYA